MNTGDFKEIRKKLIDKFESNCEKGLNNINKLRAEKINKLDKELRTLKSNLIVIGIIFIVLNFIFTFFPGIIAIVILVLVYFGKKIKSTIEIQNTLKNRLESLTLDYVSLLFTDIQREKTDLYSSIIPRTVKEVVKVKSNENMVFGNVFFGKYRDINFEIIETMVQSLSDNVRTISFNGTVYKLHFNSIYKNNTVPKKIANKVNDILGMFAVSVECDYEGNLIFALNYKISSNIEVKLDRPIKAPVIYLTELMEHLSYICQIIDTVQDYKKEAVVPDEIKKQLAQKINEIAINKINSQPKIESTISEIKPIKKEVIKEAPIIKEIPIVKEVQTKEIIKTPTIEKPKEPIKEEPIKKPEIKTEEPKAIKEVQDDTIDLIDIVEF